MAKFLLVDDHPLLRAAWQALILAEEPDAELQPVDSMAEARDALGDEGNGIALVLMDLALAQADGFELLAELHAALPDLPVLVVSGQEVVADMVRAVDAGAHGYVTQRAPQAEVLEAWRALRGGTMYLPTRLLQQAAAQGGLVGAPVQGAAPVVPPAPAAPLRTPAELGLTPRQQEVLGLLLQGLSNKLIARQLNLSVETVKDHVAAVLRALGVATRMQAVLHAGRLLQPGSFGPPRRPPLG